MSKKDWSTKKKKHHKGWIIFGVLMTIFVVFPVAFVFGAFYDTSTKNVSDSDIHYENIVAETFYKSIGNLVKEGKDFGKLKFTINEEMFDGILMSACDKINQKKFIPKMYCDIDGNNYNFYIDLQASFFKTRLILKTTLTGTETELLTFKINGITVGRLPLPINWVTGIAGNFITDEMLNNIFEQAHFRFESHLADAKLTYKREYFKKDIGKYVDDLAKNNPYLGLILDIVDDNENLFSADYYNGVSAIIDLNAFAIPGYTYNPPMTFIQNDLDAHKVAVKNWLNLPEGALEEKDAGVAFSYLLRGYEDGNETVKNFITGIQGSQLEKAIKEYISTYAGESITDITAYKGSEVTDGTAHMERITFQDYYKDAEEITITPDTEDLPNSFGITLDAASLNKYLAFDMTDAIGKTIPITYQEGKEYGFEYIIVDNLYMSFPNATSNPTMEMYLSMNLSGFQICLKLTCGDIKIGGTDSSTSTVGSLRFDLQSINFGSIKINRPELLSKIVELIPPNDDFTYHTDDPTKNGYFAIGLDKYVDSQYKQSVAVLIEGAGNPTGSATNNKLTLTYSK